MTSNYDLIIAGAGPAGCTAAMTYKLHNPNAKILVFDKQEFPRHKIGEVILPGAMMILDKLGISQKIIEKNFPRKMGVYFFWGQSQDEGFLLPSNNLQKQGESYIDTTPHIHSYHVDRSEYDMLLVDEMRERGIEFLHESSLDSVVWKDEEKEEIDFLEINKEQYSADFYIDTAGIHGSFTSKEQRNTESFDFSGDICMHLYVKGAERLFEFPGLDNYVATTVTSHSNQCWSFYVPIGKGVTSMGIVFKAKHNKEILDIEDKVQAVLSTMRANSKLKDALLDIEVIQSYQGLPTVSTVRNWNIFSNKLHGKNWIVAGDTAFFSDPILSAGVTMAQRTGYYVGLILTNIKKQDNPSLSKLYMKTYEKYCSDFFNQVRTIIEFWYRGMDSDLGIEELFKQGDVTLKSFGILDTSKVDHSFLYLINGFFQTLEENGDELSGDYEQEDYYNLIKGITGFSPDLDISDVGDTIVYIADCNYKITKRMKLYKYDFVFFPYLILENQYKTKMFVSVLIKEYISFLGESLTIGEFLSRRNLSEKQTINFKKSVKKLELLGLFRKENKNSI